jgi:hypothetical protein
MPHAARLKQKAKSKYSVTRNSELETLNSELGTLNSLALGVKLSALSTNPYQAANTSISFLLTNK